MRMLFVVLISVIVFSTLNIAVAAAERRFDCQDYNSLDACVLDAREYLDADPPGDTACQRRGVRTQWECWSEDYRRSMVQYMKNRMIELPVGGVNNNYADGYRFKVRIMRPSENQWIIELY